MLDPQTRCPTDINPFESHTGEHERHAEFTFISMNWRFFVLWPFQVWQWDWAGITVLLSCWYCGKYFNLPHYLCCISAHKSSFHLLSVKNDSYSFDIKAAQCDGWIFNRIISFVTTSNTVFKVNEMELEQNFFVFPFWNEED